MATETPYLDPAVVSRLKNIEVRAKLIVEGFITGLHRSPYHGFSVEFAEHRPYNPGENLRNIDWRAYAKTDKLFTKRYEEETNLRCHIVLDASDSMRYPLKNVAKNVLTKLEYGSYLAASLAYLMILQRDAVGFTLFDDKIRYQVPPKAKKSWLMPILLKLEETARSAEYFQHRTATADVLHTLAQKFGRRGLVVLITDLFTNVNSPEAILPALQHLRHANHEVLVFHLLDHETETRFDFPNQPLILQDLETGEELRVQPEQVKAAYREKMDEYRTFFRKRMRELQIEFVEVDVRTPYDKVLTDYLVKRNSMMR